MLDRDINVSAINAAVQAQLLLDSLDYPSVMVGLKAGRGCALVTTARADENAREQNQNRSWASPGMLHGHLRRCMRHAQLGHGCCGRCAARSAWLVRL
jgi:hypothetical protein